MQSQGHIYLLYDDTKQSVRKFLNPNEMHGFARFNRSYFLDKNTELDWFKAIVQENANYLHPGLLVRIKNPPLFPALTNHIIKLNELDALIHCKEINFKLRFLLNLYRLKISHSPSYFNDSLKKLYILTHGTPLEKIVKLYVAEWTNQPELLRYNLALCKNFLKSGPCTTLEILSLFSPSAMKIAAKKFMNAMECTAADFTDAELPKLGTILSVGAEQSEIDEFIAHKSKFVKKTPLSYQEMISLLNELKINYNKHNLVEIARLATQFTPTDFFPWLGFILKKINSELREARDKDGPCEEEILKRLKSVYDLLHAYFKKNQGHISQYSLPVMSTLILTCSIFSNKFTH